MTTQALKTSVLRAEIAITTNASMASMMKAPISVPASENRPPASEVPPMTTARIASSSMNSPIELGSAEVELDVNIRPARPAQNPLKT